MTQNSMNTDICKFESLQSEKSNAQPADSLKVCSTARAFQWNNAIILV